MNKSELEKHKLLFEHMEYDPLRRIGRIDFRATVLLASRYLSQQTIWDLVFQLKLKDRKRG